SDDAIVNGKGLGLVAHDKVGGHVVLLIQLLAASQLSADLNTPVANTLGAGQKGQLEVAAVDVVAGFLLAVIGGQHDAVSLAGSLHGLQNGIGNGVGNRVDGLQFGIGVHQVSSNGHALGGVEVS